MLVEFPNSRVVGEFTTQICRFHIFNCEDGGYGFLFFFREKIDVPGSV